MISKGDKINDRYQIVKNIGEGGMANVYLANDLILNRKVAVKVLRGDLADDEKFVRRFQREAMSASKLSHSNIVEMYDVGEDNGNYYIVMEYVNGKTLKALVKKRGGLTLPEVVDIMSQLTSAVMCAHDSYIIHRDIKPQNVLILDDGKVKITDFGIAVALNSNELTQTNSVMGSVHYLPPEQANGSGATIKSDIYSLGILMYELITGKIPFKGDNAVEIAIKQMREPIPSVCEMKPDVPQSVENIILKSCAKNISNRYDSVTEMHNDISICLSDEVSQEKYVYEYSEHDVEEVKKMAVKKNPTKKTNVKKISDKKENKVKDILLWITGSVLVLLITIICLAIIVYPTVMAVNEVKVPDISKQDEATARIILSQLGLDVSETVKYKNSDVVNAGNVIGTDPSVGRTVKEGSSIVLVLARDSGKVIVDDYVSKNYKLVESALNDIGLNVTLEGKKIEKSDQSNYTEGAVLTQSVTAGSLVEVGTTVKITYAVFISEYPDFTSGYSLVDINNFCVNNDVALEIKYVMDDSLPDGTIMAQNRTGEVVSGSTLTITVSQALADE